MKIRIEEIGEEDKAYVEVVRSGDVVELSVGNSDSARRAFYVDLEVIEAEALCNALELIAGSIQAD